MKKPIPFGNKYLLLERVNVGGMAEVFKAKAFGVEGFERLIAVKRILPSIAEDQEFITMFIDEAKIAVQLTHANVAQIFDLGKVADSYFIAMEFVRGKDLRAIFDRVRKRGGTVPVPMACYTIMKVCEGLDYAHNKKDSAGRDLNLVHRDVSPQNVLLSYDGEIKLIDFGIAKAANKAGKTQAGILKGKFGYMSPEQVRGLPLDRRSDVFSVGIVLYELLTGERLFVGESDFSTLEKVRNVEIMPPSTYNRKIPEELEQIVLKALAKDVDDRYQTAMDLHDDLQSFMYTSGNFFARKDLAAYMGKAFAEEITREEARDEQYRKIRAPGDSGLDAFDDLPRRSEPAKQPPAPPAAANVSKAPPPPPPRPKPQKRTMMGMGAVAPPPPRPSAPQPPPPRPSAPQPPPPQPQGPALDMDWDDDELATQIYDKPEGELFGGPGMGMGPGPQPQPQQHSPMLSAPTAAPRGSGAGAPSPFGGPGPSSAPPPRPGLPSPFDDLPPDSGPATEPPHREPTAVTRQPKSERGGSMGMIIGIGVVVLLALAGGAWYMLRPPEPGTVHLTTEPADPTVLFDDQQVQATSSPFVLANVEPGAHLIEVRKTGYQTWSTQIDLRPGQTLTLPPVTLRPEEGGDTSDAGEGTGFALTSTPAGAKVFVDGRELDGTTPLRVEDLPAGSHTIRVEADGRRTWQRQIQLAAGQIMDLDAELEGATVSVRFESSPRGAEVTLVRGDDREEIGTTPVREDVDLSGGAWTIEMSRTGYETWSEELEVPEGEDRFTVEAELDRETRVATNVMRRRTNTGGGGGGGGGGDTMTMAATGGTGTLRVNTRPWSQVYVDGRLIGNTPQMNITVSAGSHRLTLVNPDFNIRHNVTVNVAAGATETKVINLPTN